MDAQKLPRGDPGAGIKIGGVKGCGTGIVLNSSPRRQPQKDFRTEFNGRKCFSIRGRRKGLRNRNCFKQQPQETAPEGFLDGI